MKRQHQIAFFTSLLLATLINTFDIHARKKEVTQTAEEKSPLVAQMEYLVRDGGEWTTKNEEYNPKDKNSPHSFGYKFEWGLHQRIVKLRIFGIYNNGQRLDFWDSIYAWHPVEKKIKAYQFGSGGAIATGESFRVDDKTNQVSLTFVQPDGGSFDYKNVMTVLGPDEFRSTSYHHENGEWKLKRASVWRWVKTEKMN